MPARVAGPLAEIATGLTEVVEEAMAPSGPPRITMPLLAADELVMPRLAEFTALYPSIELDIRASDIFEDIVQSGCDAGIRLGESLEADMIAVRMEGTRRGLIVATPDHFTRQPQARPSPRSRRA